ncbi:MAG: glycosyltransferase [Cytophagales bacterium]|nr:MAG: glycosyltransferase [Cytophagales bacterium]
MNQTQDYDIIIFTLSRWDSPISSPSLSLAKEFAKHNRVFYIDHPYSFKDFLKERNQAEVKQRTKALLLGKDAYKTLHQFSSNLIAVTTQLTLPVNFLPKGSLYNTLSRYNDNIVFKAIRNIIKDFSVKKFIFINAFDPYFCRQFPEDIQPFRTVYQSMDDLSQVTYTAKHGIALEADIIKKYDITLTTSKELTRLKLQHSPSVYYHPNAADISIFGKTISEKFERPKELIGFEDKKIIGYTGNIESRIDYQLLQKVIETHQDKLICMVGPITTDEHESIGLKKYKNVILIGPKKITELPQYLQYFDCTLIPFKKNILTKSIYPLKINEYLSAGKAVVATNFSEDIEGFGNVIYIGKDTDEFVDKIAIAINSNRQEQVSQRVAFAQTNTWTARVESFWEIIHESTKK